MQKKSDIASILNAVNEINLKKKKIFSNTFEPKNFIPKLNQDLTIPLDVDKIIREAEEFKTKTQFKSSQIDLIKNRNDGINTTYTTKSKNEIKHFDEIQTQVIDALYSKLKKKVKKNTLKIIFNLNLKIKDLEKQLENFQIKKTQPLNKNELTLKNEAVESSKTTDQSITDLKNVLFNNKHYLKDEVVESLKIQDSTITMLSNKIKNYKSVEEKLRFKIIDLEQDKTILLKKTENFKETKDHNRIINNTKENLISIYKQVKRQKEIFLNLKNYLAKIERDFNFYKDNYEKLIIENNDIKKKLSNTKDQVEAFEAIKKELVLTFENFNNVLSKNSIIKLNESFSKINTNLDIPNTNIKK
jgi:hypothetical protein